ncbi:MAG: radical SAM protein [Eubacteriales bacterium]
MTGNERRPLSLLIKPVSGECNLACRYCFYRAETLMRKTRDFGRMSGKTADELIQSAVKAASGSLTFSFQGGEPTLWGLDNFRRFRDKALAAAEESAPGLDVRFTTQTNGVLIAEDNRFAEFFAENNWLVGLSIDGTPPLHDLNRPAPGGKGSYEAALKAAENLKAAGAEFNILTVVTDQMAKRASRIYNDYKSRGWNFMQFIPCIDTSGDENDRSLSCENWGLFQRNLFDCWYRDIKAYLTGKGERVSVRRFDDLVRAAAGLMPEECGSRGGCSVQYVVEGDGSVYPCDFYCLDEWKMGYIKDGIKTLFESPAARRFLETGFPNLNEKCRSCGILGFCRFGCRRYRTGIPGENEEYIYCEAEKALIGYAGRRLSELSGYLRR